MRGAITITGLASAMGLIALISGGVAYINNMQSEAEEKINELDTKLQVFSKDYELTVKRIDQNMAAIGKALKVNVVTGEILQTKLIE